MKKAIIIVAACMTFAIPAICAAAPARPGGYVTGFLGVSVPKDSSVTTSDFLNNNTFSDKVEFDPGVYIGGTGGYDFGIVRVEGELSYKHSDLKSITDQADGYQFRNVDGNLGVLAMMFNTFFDLHNDTPVTPYVGGGIGFASLHLSDTYGTDTRGTTVQRPLLYLSDSDTVFAYQLGAGIAIALNRRLSLDLGYRYFGTDTASFGGDWTTSTKLKYESHNAAVGIRVKF